MNFFTLQNSPVNGFVDFSGINASLHSTSAGLALNCTFGFNSSSIYKMLNGTKIHVSTHF
jgi:hypothetical protein